MSIVPLQRPMSVAARPASLTKAGTAPSGVCPECGSARVTSLAMTLTDGTPVEFASCHDCEHRHWAHEGEVLAFADVITRTTRTRERQEAG
jgi:formate dehydrogenase maturation protein FdhE